VGIPVHRPEGNMVIDIGGGTTDVAVISLSAIAHGESVRVAGDEIDESIVRYMRLQHHLSIGIFEGERVKKEIGSACSQKKKLTTEVKGLNIKTGVPMSISIDDDEIREALKEPLTTIVSSIMHALEKIPPELSADIHSNGIYLTGGGALIRGLDKMIEEKTTLKVFIPEDPLLSIVKGAGAVLDDFDNLKKVCIN
jgi:rod shape-determining protein MreB